MSLITRTSQPAFAIVDDVTLAQWLRIDTNSDPQTVDMLLASATDYIENLTGQVICEANYTITFDKITSATPFNLFPILSIIGVTANLADQSTKSLVDRTDYIVNLATRSPSITFLAIPNDTVSITINVKAGYSNVASVPASLKHAAAVLVAAGYDSRNALDQSTIDTVANLTNAYRNIVVG